jgi:hypothetical protein
MDVGMMMVFASYGWGECSDGRRRSGWLGLPPTWASTVSRSLSLFESPACAVRDFGTLELHADP